MNTLEILNPFTIAEALIDNSLKAFTAANAAQEQGEKFFRLMLDQNRVVREQGMNMAQHFGEQARENQRIFTNLVNGSMKAGLDAVKIVSQQGVADVAKHVEQVNQGVAEAIQKSKRG